MKYINGLFAKRKSEKSPDFVICNGSINKDQMQETLTQMDGEWINFQINKPYTEDPAHPERLTIKINDWKPDNAKPAPVSEPVKEESFDEDVPF
tara:strand:- start:819 stop:1100 length:282 start_codon:yes stop_codon:yes gene_type:complete